MHTTFARPYTMRVPSVTVISLRQAVYTRYVLCEWRLTALQHKGDTLAYIFFRHAVP